MDGYMDRCSRCGEEATQHFRQIQPRHQVRLELLSNKLIIRSFRLIKLSLGKHTRFMTLIGPLKVYLFIFFIINYAFSGRSPSFCGMDSFAWKQNAFLDGQKQPDRGGTQWMDISDPFNSGFAAGNISVSVLSSKDFRRSILIMP